ncbi:LuxR C-terminal-related transcriptional regulator [Streptomyces sp. NPDC005479]|uniref:LuxR C-terminal-related transcriptional regulator n=1 Tax=Streptomyces sp. NPDC005479 TaxID=3154879 RepID=UPI0033A3FE95
MPERMAPWPLTGRERERAAFASAWAESRLQAVVIFGPAGVGKTRLAEDYLAQAARDGWKGGRATASAATAAVPFGAIAHLIPTEVDLSDPVQGFATVARTLAGPQHGRRWAFMVDDLHLLDATSAVLLRQLLDNGAIRLIATVRTEEPVTEAVEALTRGDAVHRIDLVEFDREQTERLLRAVLGQPVGRRTLEAVHAASGGNVLYLRELVLDALAAGTLTSDGEIWELADDRPVATGRLAELIGARLARADEAARPVLELLALCGPIAFTDARILAPMDVLVALETAGLIQVTTDRRRTSMQLAHPLYGEILRAAIPALQRRTLLLQQAGRIETYGLQRRDDALHLAAWTLAAKGTADPVLLVRAAGLARYAHDYPQAVTLLQALPEEDHTPGSRVMLGDVLFELGDPHEAEAVLKVAAERAVSEQDVLAVTMTRTFILVWAGARGQDALAINAAARAQVHSTEGMRALRYNEGAIRVASGEPERGLTMLTDLEQAIRDAPDPVAWLTAVTMKSYGLALTGRTIGATDWARRAHAAHLAVDHQTLFAHPAVQLISLTAALSNHGGLSEARDVSRQGYTQLTAARTPPVPQIWMAILAGYTEWLAGHPAAARGWYAESIALARRSNHTGALRPALGGLAACAAVLGDLKAAEHACAVARTHPSLPCMAAEESLGPAWLHAARGHFARARAELLDSAQHVRAAGMVIPEALLLTDIARLGGAAQVTDRLAELAQLCDGPLISGRARLAAALAADDSSQLLTVSRDLEEIGADLLAAEAAAAAAEGWQRTGESRRANAAAQRAQVCAARCQGAHTPLLTTGRATASLTHREREIAQLATSGTATSKEIADTLHLSVRTVENHLQRAYSKLGVTNRRELADALLRQDVAEPRRTVPGS